MGYMRHHAILITTYGEEYAQEAHKQATLIFESEPFRTLVSEPLESAINGYWSFAIFPDGSKEGWPDSDHGDVCRAKMKEWLWTKRYSDGSSPYAWVEVQYGEDDRETRVVDDSDRLRRALEEVE